MLRLHERHVNGIDQVLVGLAHHLVEHERESSGGVQDLAQHDDQLADDDSLVELALDRR